jgi:hypothetical protein
VFVQVGHAGPAAQGERGADLNAGRAVVQRTGEAGRGAVGARDPERQAEPGHLLRLHRVAVVVEGLSFLVDSARSRGGAL